MVCCKCLFRYYFMIYFIGSIVMCVFTWNLHCRWFVSNKLIDSSWFLWLTKGILFLHIYIKYNPYKIIQIFNSTFSCHSKFMWSFFISKIVLVQQLLIKISHVNYLLSYDAFVNTHSSTYKINMFVPSLNFTTHCWLMNIISAANSFSRLFVVLHYRFVFAFYFFIF